MCLGRFRNSGVSELVHKTERLRATNRALHCAVRRHFVSDLLAMRLHSMSANATRLLPSSFVISPQGFVLQSNGTAFAVQNPRIVSIKKTSRTEFNLFLVWWRCGDLNPGSSFYTRHLLHAYSVIKFSYRRSPTDGGFEEAENADLLTAVGKSVARSV